MDVRVLVVQVDETSFVFAIERANEVNHMTVFLLGSGKLCIGIRLYVMADELVRPMDCPLEPFPPGYAGSVYFQFPGREFIPLGM